MKLPAKADSEEEKPSKQNDLSWAPKVRNSNGLIVSKKLLEVELLTLIYYLKVTKSHILAF